MPTENDVYILRLTTFVRELPGFEVHAREGACYAHMGATICDSILQAGLNYRTVVAPRIQRVIQHWPSAKSTSRFLALLSRFGLNEVLIWSHPEKPTRIGQFAEFLAAREIETETEFAEWLSVEGNSESMKQVRGVGPKTVDYVKSLVGLSAIAVDRHVRSFVNQAGIGITDYSEINQVVSAAADELQVERSAFDHAIWSYVVARSGQRRE